MHRDRHRFKALLDSAAVMFSMLLFSLSANPGRTAPDFAGSVLAAHNRERMRLGLAGLDWSDRLAGEAAQWARKLASEGRLRHANQQERAGAGENLWMGTSGFYDTETIIGTFTDEKALFVSGSFPHVSRSGRWQDVGHYTQIIWPDTREVGCATAEAQGREVVVCRYWPAGNWVGHTVG